MESEIARYQTKAPPSFEALKSMYRSNLESRIRNAQAQAGAEEDVFVEDWRRKNPGRVMEQARSAYRSRAGSVGNPVKAPDSNSAEIKFGKRGGGMFGE
jgi:hypothetical protein